MRVQFLNCAIRTRCYVPMFVCTALGKAWGSCTADSQLLFNIPPHPIINAYIISASIRHVFMLPLSTPPLMPSLPKVCSLLRARFGAEPECVPGVGLPAHLSGVCRQDGAHGMCGCARPVLVVQGAGTLGTGWQRKLKQRQRLCNNLFDRWKGGAQHDIFVLACARYESAVKEVVS